MADPNTDFDPQDTAEAFDEENLDDTETYKFRTFEENPELLDLTQAIGDGDGPAALEDEDFQAGAVDDEDLEEELERVRTDAYDESDLDDPVDLDALHDVDDQEPDEAPLVYVGDVDNLKGAQSSAAHFEPRAPLGDDDVEALGYGGEDRE